MTDMSKDQTPFDERAALAELERFRQDIQRYRMRREAVGHEFDKFIESMPAPEEVFPVERVVPPAQKIETPHVAPPEPLRPQAITPRAPAPSTTRPAASTPPRAAAATAAPAPPGVPFESLDRNGEPEVPVPSPQRKKRVTPFLIAVGVLFAIGAFATSVFRSREPHQQQSQAPSPASLPAPVQSAPTPPAPAPMPPTESEITTVRRAWVRVIADGERVVERELPADARVAFKAEKTIVIRTGDAGAVKLAIRGQDQGPLGRAGEVITRSFTVPASPPR